MNKKTLIIGGSVLGLLVVGYFVFRKKNDVGTPETGEENKDDSVVSTSDGTNTSSNQSSGNEVKPKPAPTPVPPKTDNKQFNLQVDYIDKNGIGTYADKKFLDKKNPKYVSSWYNAIKSRKKTSNKKGTTFVYNGDVYDSFYGVKHIESNPIGKVATAKKDAYAYRNAEIGGAFSKIGVSNGKSVGIVKGYKFNPKDKSIWLYIPDTLANLSLTNDTDLFNEFRWVLLSDFSLSIPKK
jgi:hypothetical protein